MVNNNFMKKYLKFGLIFVSIYIGITVIGLGVSFVGNKILGDHNPLTMFVGLPVIIINLFGAFITPNLLPEAVCHRDIIFCTSPFGIAFLVASNIIFFFLMGVIISMFFSNDNGERNKILKYVFLAIFLVVFGIVFKALFLR